MFIKQYECENCHKQTPYIFRVSIFKQSLKSRAQYIPFFRCIDCLLDLLNNANNKMKENNKQN